MEHTEKENKGIDYYINTLRSRIEEFNSISEKPLEVYLDGVKQDTDHEFNPFTGGFTITFNE